MTITQNEGTTPGSSTYYQREPLPLLAGGRYVMTSAGFSSSGAAVVLEGLSQLGEEKVWVPFTPTISADGVTHFTMGSFDAVRLTSVGANASSKKVMIRIAPLRVSDPT